MKTSKFGNVHHYMLNLFAIEAARPDAIALSRELVAIWPEYAESMLEIAKTLGYNYDTTVRPVEKGD